MEKFYLEKITKLYKCNKISANEVIELAKAVLDEERNTKKRLQAIKCLESLKYDSQDIFNIFESLMVSDENPIVRLYAGKALLHNFAYRSKELFNWIFKQEKSIVVLTELEKFLNEEKNEINKSFLIELYQRLSSNYGLVFDEVKFLLEIEKFLGKSEEIGYYKPQIENSHVIGLQLSDSKLTKLPKSIGMLSELKYLNLWNNKLYSLPQSFECLNKLEQLYLDWNFFSNIPNISWVKLNSMKKLSITNNFNLKSLPNSIFNLAGKIFASNYIKEGVNVKEAPILALLEFLTGQKLEKIEENENLNKFYACNYKIDNEGSVLGIFLYGYHSFQINFIPEQLIGFYKLEELILREQNLKFVPLWIDKFKHLKKIDFINNEITKIPPTINNLDHLSFLDMEGNDIKNLHEIKCDKIDLWV